MTATTLNRPSPSAQGNLPPLWLGKSQVGAVAQSRLLPRPALRGEAPFRDTNARGVIVRRRAMIKWSEAAATRFSRKVSARPVPHRSRRRQIETTWSPFRHWSIMARGGPSTRSAASAAARTKLSTKARLYSRYKRSLRSPREKVEIPHRATDQPVQVETTVSGDQPSPATRPHHALNLAPLFTASGMPARPGERRCYTFIQVRTWSTNCLAPPFGRPPTHSGLRPPLLSMEIESQMIPRP